MNADIVEICKDSSSIVEGKEQEWLDLFILDEQMATIDGSKKGTLPK